MSQGNQDRDDQHATATEHSPRSGPGPGGSASRTLGTGPRGGRSAPGWQGAIADYVGSLRAGGRSAATIVLYRHYANLMAGRLRSDPWAVSDRELEELLGSVEWGRAARKSLRTVIGGFYRWAYRTGRVDHDPTTLLPTVRVPKGHPRPTPEAVILDALHRADDRTRLMVELGALAGLRAGEISKVHRDDLNGDVLLVHGKGAKERLVPLARGSLVDAIAGSGGYLFPNVQRGGHITANHVSKLLSGLLPAPWTGHTLRHRFGTKAYERTRDLLAVSKLLGHASPETTLIYVQMPEDALRAAVEAADTLGPLAA